MSFSRRVTLSITSSRTSRMLYDSSNIVSRIRNRITRIRTRVLRNPSPTIQETGNPRSALPLRTLGSHSIGEEKYSEYLLDRFLARPRARAEYASYEGRTF